mmetsp:Transcript_11044/g.24355  ORF Transcript_11044/g.24355 Transcript_11044/m.24355 type:complete len:382 (+) Transcript_11044:188-1333(+)
MSVLCPVCCLPARQTPASDSITCSTCSRVYHRSCYPTETDTVGPPPGSSLWSCAHCVDAHCIDENRLKVVSAGRKANIIAKRIIKELKERTKKSRQSAEKKQDAEVSASSGSGKIKKGRNGAAALQKGNSDAKKTEKKRGRPPSKKDGRGFDEGKGKNNKVAIAAVISSPQRKKTKKKNIATPRNGKQKIPAVLPPSPENIFQVETIIDDKKINGNVLYKVRWKDYGSDEDTWEPLENLWGAEETVKKYEAKKKKKKNEKQVATPRKKDKSVTGKNSTTKTKVTKEPIQKTPKRSAQKLSNLTEAELKKNCQSPPPKRQKNTPKKKAGKNSTTKTKVTKEPIQKTPKRSAQKLSNLKEAESKKICQSSPPKRQKNTPKKEA